MISETEYLRNELNKARILLARALGVLEAHAAMPGPDTATPKAAREAIRDFSRTTKLYPTALDLVAAEAVREKA